MDFSLSSILPKFETGFLFNNKYSVSFSGIGSAVLSLFDSDIGFACNNITLPSHTYNVATTNINGVPANKVVSYEKGNIAFTLYNTGREYDIIRQWADAQHNIVTGDFSFPDDTMINITVTEYDQTGTARITHSFQGCNLLSYGTTEHSYNEVSEINTVQVETDFRFYVGERIET